MMKLFFAFAIISAPLYGQGTSAGMGSLKLPLEARSGALGGATIADISPTSFADNPALLSDATGLTFSLSHQNWIQDIHTEAFFSIVPVSFGTLGFSVSSTNIPGIELREIPGPSLGEFTARSAIFRGTASIRLAPDISAGLSLNYLYEKILVDDANGVGVDLGVSYTPPIKDSKVGISLLHVGSMNRFRTERGPLPTTLAFGASYGLSFDKFSLLLLGSQLFELQEHHAPLRAGLEGSFLDSFRIRLGYQSGPDARGVSYGVGILYAGVNFDYAYVPFSYDLGNAHLITLGLSL